MSDHTEHPFPCCGGLAFHGGGAACEAYRSGASALACSPARFRWNVRPNTAGAPVLSPAQVEQGHAFRAIRILYGLRLREVAAGWGLSDVEVGELERGHRHFASPADMHAALLQLWCWANEKNPEIHR